MDHKRLPSAESQFGFFQQQSRAPAMLLKNVSLFGYGRAEENGKIGNVYVDEKGQIEIVNDAKAAQLPATVVVFDAKGEHAVMPGWLDAHVHGYGGPDFADASSENLPVITKALGDTGLSYCMATLVSLDLIKMKESLAAIDAYVVEQNKNPTPGSAQIVGVHLEGPYIAKNCKGAHDEKVLQPKIDIESFKEIIRAAPNISQWKLTLAPDIEGAIEFIRQAQNLEVDGRKITVKVFIGHTNAREDQIEAAVKAGAVGFTHLGNANQEEAHRCAGFHIMDRKHEHSIEEKDLKSNVVRWVVKNAKSNQSYVELIVDGEHLSQPFVKMIREKVGDRIVQITDALGPSGLKDGEYKLGTLFVLKQGEKFVLKDNPEKLAGSAATYGTVVQKYGEWIGDTGSKLLHSIYSAAVQNPRDSSLHPAFKLPDDRNLVMLDKHGQLVMSLCNGKITRESLLLKADETPRPSTPPLS